MSAQSAISHALIQGAGPACMRPGMGTQAAPAQAPSLGVSLAKATYGELAVWERELIFRADAGLVRDGAVDRAMAMGPIGADHALIRNDLRALSVVLGVMARLGGVR